MSGKGKSGEWPHHAGGSGSQWRSGPTGEGKSGIFSQEFYTWLARKASYAEYCEFVEEVIWRGKSKGKGGQWVVDYIEWAYDGTGGKDKGKGGNNTGGKGCQDWGKGGKGGKGDTGGTGGKNDYVDYDMGKGGKDDKGKKGGKGGKDSEFGEDHRENVKGGKGKEHYVAKEAFYETKGKGSAWGPDYLAYQAHVRAVKGGKDGGKGGKKG